MYTNNNEKTIPNIAENRSLHIFNKQFLYFKDPVIEKVFSVIDTSLPAKIPKNIHVDVTGIVFMC